MAGHNKITTGFVIQNYVTLNGKHICVGQEFIAGDPVDYETPGGASIEIDTENEQYQPFDMVNPPAGVGEEGLIFTCPDCKGNRLECCEDGPYNSEVLNIEIEGDFDFGGICASGEPERFQCLHCGYVLTSKEDGFAEYNITEHIEIVEWIQENCEQPEEK